MNHDIRNHGESCLQLLGYFSARSLILLAFISVIALINGNAKAASLSIKDVPEDFFQFQFEHDITRLRNYVDNIENTVNVIEADNELFHINRKQDFTIEEREKLYGIWENFLDYILAFDSLGEFYRYYYLLPDMESHSKAFLLTYSAYIAKFSNALRLISKTINNELYEKKLDDENTEYGIPGGMYAKLKWNTIHVKDVSNILAGYHYYKFLNRRYEKEGLTKSRKSSWVFEYINIQYKYITKELRLKGAVYFAANGLDILRDQTLSAWFPVQKNVAIWMGNTKIKRWNAYLISHEQIDRMDMHLEPGDVIVSRKNWYLSNVGLPGFWPHAELYIGTIHEMKEFFADESVNVYYRSIGEYKNYMDYLKKKYPEVMIEFLSSAPDGYSHQIIEAVSEGVKFSSLHEAASADYIGVMRTRLSKLDIAKAIDEAFYHIGRPYDYNFDFLTDSALVCSELIYKIYMGGQGKKGLNLDLKDIAGRKVFPPNSIVEKFDIEFGTPEQELDFVYFLDGSEKDKKAAVKGWSEFRKSHKRFKWDIAQK